MTQQTRIELGQGSTVAVIGGGPAGAFFALHLLRKARVKELAPQVMIFERRRSGAPLSTRSPCWQGCNYCAGGISPRLSDVLKELHLELPEEVIQSRVRSITIQGFWKNIELEVPPGREMLSVYRGSRPAGRPDRADNFDSFLLDEALKAGASLIAGEVLSVRYGKGGKPLLRYVVGGAESWLEADLAVFAAGVNEHVGIAVRESRMVQALQGLLPDFVPPRLRRAMIFELEAKPGIGAHLLGSIHFVEYGSRSLRLEMCSLVPKRDYITAVLVGPAIDAAVTCPGHSHEVISKFLQLPHIHKLVSRNTRLRSVCACAPNMVVNSARNPFGDRVAAIGDLVTARLYKDGILSAEQTARALAEAVVRMGIDATSLNRGYGPTVRRFCMDNRYAALVFLVHRLCFSSSVLSRVLYQAVISERKSTPGARRHLEKILWRIASGDDEYRAIFFSLVHPATLWSVLTAGALITLRNHLTERAFGLRWEGFGRFTTGVALERLEGKRREFSRLLAEARVAAPEQPEFERMYTIKIGAPRENVLQQLACFGEADRGYLRPRWVRVQRIAGLPNVPGCVIRYEVLRPRFCFSLVLEQLVDEHLAVYRVQDGFARGGVLIFEVEKLAEELCALSIYVAFDFARGQNRLTRPLWWFFRLLFPAFIHDVLWNHSLCQLKDVVETALRPPIA